MPRVYAKMPIERKQLCPESGLVDTTVASKDLDTSKKCMACFSL